MRVWVFLYGRILRYSVLITAFFMVALYGSHLLAGRTDVESLIGLIPFGVGVLCFPGMGFGFFLFLKFDYREFPFFWNRGFTMMRTILFAAVSSVSLFAILLLVLLWIGKAQ